MLIGGLTYLVASQLLDLAGSLPKYRSNLIARVASLKTHENNPLRLAVQTISEVTAALNKPEDNAPTTDKAHPLRVEVIQPADGSIHMLIPLTPVTSFSRNRGGLFEQPSPVKFEMPPSASSGG